MASSADIVDLVTNLLVPLQDQMKAKQTAEETEKLDQRKLYTHFMAQEDVEKEEEKEIPEPVKEINRWTYEYMY